MKYFLKNYFYICIVDLETGEKNEKIEERKTTPSDIKQFENQIAGHAGKSKFYQTIKNVFIVDGD